jgi:hypothetical protein
MARRRRRWRPPGGNATAAGSGGRLAPFSTDTASYIHTARSLACALLTYYSSARPFSNGIFRSNGAHVSFPFACVSNASFPCTCTSLPSSNRFTGQHNQPSPSTVLARPVCPFACVSVIQCAPASPYTCSSPTHRFPDELPPLEATPLSATSAELGSGVGLGWGFTLLLTTILSLTILFPSVH